MPDYDAVDIFAGPGGWDVAAADLGLNVIGIETDAAACATRRAAGHPTVESDVRIYGPANFPAAGLIASPPCQTFSRAGGGSGRAALDTVVDSVKSMGARQVVDTALFDDVRTGLVLEPLRWALEAVEFGMAYEWLAFEQVPPVLPVWEAMADVLRAEGYSVATGLVQAEQYGVPQTRKRAVLLARRYADVALPIPTHSRYHNRTPSRLDEGVEKWVSMAEALGWGMTRRPYLTVAPGTGAGGTDPQAVGGSGARRTIATERAEGRWIEQDDTVLCATNLRPNASYRPANAPAPTMAFGHDRPRWLSSEDLAAYRARVAAEVAPRVNDQSGTPVDLAWPSDRPAPVVAGREIVTHPGANANRYNGRTKSRNDGIRVTPQEAAVLQSFTADYPWAGGRTKVFEQIGNAVPPGLAMALLAAVIDAEIICEECGNDLATEGYRLCSECLEATA